MKRAVSSELNVACCLFFLDKGKYNVLSYVLKISKDVAAVFNDIEDTVVLK